MVLISGSNGTISGSFIMRVVVRRGGEDTVNERVEGHHSREVKKDSCVLGSRF